MHVFTLQSSSTDGGCTGSNLALCLESGNGPGNRLLRAPGEQLAGGSPLKNTRVPQGDHATH